MNGMDHFKRAEEITAGVMPGLQGAADDIALAQVHATLALAAATANATSFKREMMQHFGDDESATPKRDRQAEAQERARLLLED